MNVPSLLIVEDDPFLQMLCQKKATNSGFQVEVASDGQSAVDKIISLRPALVLLDLIIPVFDGFEVLKRVREHDDKAVAKTPVVILSNLGEKEHIDKAIALGATDFLVKANFTTDEIMDKIKNLMDKIQKQG